jgi:protein-tyrosine-phosphatase
MAEALFTSLAATRGFDVSSAGTAPAADLSGVADVLAEHGVSFTPAARTLDVTMTPDLLIVVCEEGCAACPYLPMAKRVIRWPFEDPTSSDRSRDDVPRGIADELATRIAELLEITRDAT